MDGLKCSYCGSKDITYQEYYGTYNCTKCNRILGEDEVVKSRRRKKESLEMEDVEVEYNKYEEEELSGFSLFVLNILAMIPIIGIGICFIVCNSNSKQEYKKAFGYRAIVHIIVFISPAIAMISIVKENKEQYKSAIHSTIDTVVNELSRIGGKKLIVPDLAANSMEEIMKSRVEPPTDIIDSNVEFVPTWDYIDGSILSGEKAVSFIDYAGDGWAVLVQTEHIRTRYDQNAYRNLGLQLTASEKNESSDNWFYFNRLVEPVEYYLDDYGEYVDFGYDDMRSKKYIYYVNPKYKYRLDFLYTEDNQIAGFALTEMED